MELSTVLPIIIYFLLIVLLIILIVIGIKLIITMNKVEQLITDIKSKVSALDKLFNIVDIISSRFSILTDTIVGFLTNTIKKIINRNNNNDDIDDD